MKKLIKSVILLFTLAGTNFAKSQTTIYADTVLGVSSEYSLSNATCSSGWSACRILGVPDAYPNCSDNVGAWTFGNSNTRQWIEIGYSTHLYVDTIRIYETYNSGAIDTVYLRDAQTGNWNTVYTTTANPVTGCKVLDIVIPETSYKVDALRLAIYFNGSNWFEYDAIALTGSTVSSVGIAGHQIKNTTVFPTPSTGNITVNTDGTGTSTIYIYDVLGEVVYSKKLSQQSENISLNLPSGIYFSVIEKNGKTDIEKLIIR